MTRLELRRYNGQWANRGVIRRLRNKIAARVRMGQCVLLDGEGVRGLTRAEWTSMCGGFPGIGQGTATGVYLLPDRTDKMWAVYNGTLYASEDAGSSWQKLIDGGLGRIVPSPKDPETFYVTGANGVQMTTDGKAFVPLPEGPKPVASLVIDYQHPDVLYATQGYNAGGGIWKFDGKAWSKIFDNDLISGLAIDPTDGNRLAASTNRDPFKDVCDATGAWLSADGGKTWSNQREGLACLRGWGVDINPHDPEQIFYCSQGRGFFVARWPKTDHVQ